MNKIMSLILLVLIFNSCTLVDLYLTSVSSNKELYYDSDFEWCTTPEHISWMLLTKLKTKADDGIDEWVNPETTMKRGFGDCDDFSICFANFAYLYLNIKCDIIVVSKSNFGRTVVQGGVPRHVLVEINGKPFEPQLAKYIEYDEIGYRYKFDDVFNVKEK